MIHPVSMNPETDIQRERTRRHPRLVGALLILVALILTATLATYKVDEVGWGFLNSQADDAAAERPATNILGIPGLYLAGLLFKLLGFGAYYLFLLLALEGAVRLFKPAFISLRALICLFCMVLLACAVIDIMGLGQQTAASLDLSSPGGFLGWLDGSAVTAALLGARAALILLISLHGLALIYFARTTPLLVLSEFWKGLCALAAALRGWYARRREARAQKKQQRREWRTRNPETAQEEEESGQPQQSPHFAQAQQQGAAVGLPLRPMPAPAPAPQRPAPAPTPLTLPARSQQAIPTPIQPLGPRAPQLPEQPQAAPVQQPRPAALPPRQRSTVRPGSMPQEEDFTPARPFEEREERNRREEEARPNMQQAPNSRNRLARPIVARGDNLLDLMKEVEHDIELANQDDDVRRVRPASGPTLNQRLEAAAARHMGQQPPAREPRPAAPARPAPTPAATRIATPPPRELPQRDERPQEADYPLPPYELLAYKPVAPEQGEEAQREMQEMQEGIMETLRYFKIEVTPGDITRGPSITRYEFYPPRGLRVNRIANLSNDLMLATSSKSINILAPVPGKNTVGIELANAKKTPVYLRELLQDPAFRSPDLRIPVALGKDVYGRTVIGDLAAMPHTLVAGTTGSGKSVCINSMIISMLYKFRPDELRLILVDPKVVEMQPYRRLPHLACPVVTNPGRVISALRWAVNEMEHRYKLFSKIGVRNFEDFNARSADYVPEPDEDEMQQDALPDPNWVERFASEIERQAEDEVHLGVEETQQELDFDAEENIPLRLPYIVIIVDELADLMMMVKEDLEVYISRLTQKARAAGIHLVVATQTPRSNVVTGIIKANIPSRIAFKVSSPLDSRIILDQMGAENLLGKGDFLFLPPGGISKMTRAQGAFVSDDEVAAVVKHCSRHARQNFDQNVMSEIESDEGGSGGGDNGGRIAGKGGSDEDDELYTRCVNLVVSERKASTSLLQRRFSIGYGRAAKIIDMMEERGVISPAQGATRAREVLVDAPLNE